MTTPGPGTRLQAALDGAVAARAGVIAGARRERSVWLMLPVLVAGWDASRGLTVALALAVVVVPIVLAVVLTASRQAVDGRLRDPASGPWLVAIAVAIVGAGLLALAGAGGSAIVLLVATALLAAWSGLVVVAMGGAPGLPHPAGPADVSGVSEVSGAAGPTRTRGVAAGVDRLVVPAILAVVSGLAGALLPAQAAGPPERALPVAWLVALAGWRVARDAIEEAAAAVSRRGGTDLRAGAAWLVAGGHLVAIVAAATQGPLGVLVALALLPGLLLAAMVADGRPEAAAAEGRILDRLVVVWIAVLLLVAWGTLVVDPWATTIVVTAAATGYLLLAILLTRLLTRRRRPRDADAATLVDPSLRIVLPLVRTLRDLRPLVLALRSQTYADTSVVVAALPGVDVSVAAEWLGDDAILPVDPPPPGWDPLAWVRHAALLDPTTTADLALVVDTRTLLAPVAARVLVEHARATRVDALGAIPRNALPTLGDRLAGSGPILWRFGWEPRWFVALTRGRPVRLIGADPAMVLVRVAAYRAAVERGPDAVLPADGLLRTLARDGRRIALVHAADLAIRRGEVGVAGALAWWRAMAMRLAGGTMGDVISMLLLVLLGWIAPVVLPLVAWLGGAATGLLAASLLPLALLLLARAVLAATQRGSVRAIAWHPVMAAVAVLGIVLALIDHAGGRRASTAPEVLASGLQVHDPVVRSRT